MSNPPIVEVRPDDPTPPYEQLRRQFELLIVNGDLVKGERLPSVRQLANDLQVAAGTVARTYQELEKSGFLHSRRGGGTEVSYDPAALNANETSQLVESSAQRFVNSLRLHRASDEQVIAAVIKALG
jgi:GntR family transcriptional regulator